MNKKNTNIVEANIKIHKIKELKDNKNKLEIKIKSLEENIKLIENNDISKIELNNSINGILNTRELVDENIKRAKIKEIKNAKFLLEDKLSYLDSQLKDLLSEEENKVKKFDVKVYLENFEKDKKEAELREHKWKKEQMQRARKFEEEQSRIQEKIKEKAESEEMLYLQKKQESYQKHLEKIKNKSNLIREDMSKLNEMKDEWKASPVEEKQYLFKIVEDNYKKKEIEEKEELKNKMVAELAKKKILYKPIEKQEFEEYKKKVDEERKKKLYEKEKERLLKKEEIMKKNSEMPKSDTKVYEKIVEEEKKIRENKEKEKLDKVYNAMKIKQFSKVVLKNMVPKIDEEKKQEIAERKNKQGQVRPEKLSKSKHERIILKKPDPDNPNRKYNWELKLDYIDESNTNHNKKNKKKLHARSLSKTTENNESFKERKESEISRLSHEKPKKKPLLKNHDYLTLMRNEKTKKRNENDKIDKGLETEFEDKESKFVYYLMKFFIN